MTSAAVVLLNSKTFSIMRFSSLSMAPFSSPMSTIMRISSSVTSCEAPGDRPNMRSTPLTDAFSSRTKGAVTFAVKSIGPAA